MRARSTFAWLLARTFSLRGRGSSSASAVFPLPLLDFGLFARSGPRLSNRRWLSVVKRRVLHVTIVAFNFVQNGCRPFDVSLIGRSPKALQRKMLHRLRALVTACDSPADIPMPAGRSGPEFVARLCELEEFVRIIPLLSGEGYEAGFGDIDEPLVRIGEVKEERPLNAADAPFPAAPYHSLNPSRLKFTGEGRWPLGDFLEDELWLPYREPKILRHGLPLDGCDLPDFSLEDKNENYRLALLWSTKGLLSLFEEPPQGPLFNRGFNCFKSSSCDRQIGDWRQPNAADRGIAGPSQFLPIGHMMTSLLCPRGCVLFGIVTDRKDFYHQAQITREKAHGNCLPFSYPAELFKGTAALRKLEEVVALRSKRRSRTEIGDQYGKRRTPSGVPMAEEVFPAFKSLFQDHLGVLCWRRLDFWRRGRGFLRSILSPEAPYGKDW